MTMKTAIKWALGLSAAALSIGGIAYAQQGAPGGAMHGPMRGQSMMAMMDGNSDGVVTRAEAQQAATAMFTRMDRNKDGKLDQADRDAHREEMRGQMFDRIDANHDGSISRAEFLADRGPDGDRPPMGGPMDGQATGGPGMAGMGDHMKHHGRGMHGGNGMGGHGMGGHHGGMMMARMADTDKDGAVSQAEFMAASMKHFDMADSNHDGKITKEEHQAARAKMKAEWKANKAKAPAQN